MFTAASSRSSTSPSLGAAPPLAPERPLVVGRDISPAEAERLSGEGLLVRCVADVVVCTDAWLDRDTRAECLGLVLWREGVDPGEWVVGHEAAAWVHCGALDPATDPARRYWSEADPGTGTHDTHRSPALEQVVVLGPRGRSARYAGVVVHRQAALTDDEVTTTAGILVTTPARTAADLLRLLPPAAACAELRRLCAATSLTPEAIAAALLRRRGARGLARAHRVLQEWAREQASVWT